MDHPELQDLVDAPRERLEVEYKAWLNLDDGEVRAGLAKHLCAIANHGDGFVVFGIANDMTPAGPQPPESGPYGQDSLSGIVRRQHDVNRLLDHFDYSSRHTLNLYTPHPNQTLKPNPQTKPYLQTSKIPQHKPNPNTKLKHTFKPKPTIPSK